MLQIILLLPKTYKICSVFAEKVLSEPEACCTCFLIPYQFLDASEEFYYQSWFPCWTHYGSWEVSLQSLLPTVFLPLPLQLPSAKFK